MSLVWIVTWSTVLSCLCPYPTTTLGRAGPVLYLGSTVELTLMAGEGEPASRAWEKESWPCLLLAAALGEPAGAVLKSPPWWSEHRRAGRLTNSATSQAQTQSLDLAHSSIYLTSDLLEHMRTPVLHFCRISITQGNKRTSERSSCEDPAYII